MTREVIRFDNISLQELGQAALAVSSLIDSYKVWLFHGEMGSGKTTLIKAIGNALGVTDSMSSPTFAIVNEYHAKDHQTIFHFDFYRIKNEAEAIDIGTEEYFYSGHPCFVEWPEKIPSLIPATYAEVFIQVEDENHRTLMLSVHDGEKENRL